MTPEIAKLLKDMLDDLDAWAVEMEFQADSMKDMGEAAKKSVDQFKAKMIELGWNEKLVPKVKKVRRTKKAVEVVLDK